MDRVPVDRVIHLEEGIAIELHDRPCQSNEDCNRVKHLLVDAGRKHVRLIVDFSQVTSISASFLSTLLSAYKSLGARPGDIVLCSLQPVPRQVFELTRLDQIFPLCEDRSEALRLAWPVPDPQIVEAK